MRRVLTAVLAAVLTVVLAEAAATLGVSRAAAHSYDVVRTPHDRFWMQYTAPRPRPDGHRLILLISNSQGHVGRDGGRGSYPARLQALLQAADPAHGYTVANWSLPGGNAPEMVVLAARAADHRPDVLLFVSYSRNFQRRRGDLAPTVSDQDLTHLAYAGPVRRLLAPWFLQEFALVGPRGWLSAHSRLLQLQTTVVSMAQGRGGGRQAREAQRALRAARPWSGMSARLLDEFVSTVRRGLPSTPLLIVSMPLNLTQFTPGSRLHLEAFAREARAQAGSDPGITVLEAMTLLDPSQFTDNTHLTDEGHERFARWLLGPVLHAMGTAAP